MGQPVMAHAGPHRHRARHACMYLAAALAITACSPQKPEPAPAPAQRKVSRVSDGTLPPELAPYAVRIDASRLAYTGISLTAPDRLAPWSSRLGGPAYLPKGQAYPRDPDGVPLALLAQLNFSEMPALAGYPSRGILQFFLAGGNSTAHIYGSSPEYAKPFDQDRYRASLSEQRYFRVIFHAQVEINPDKLERPPAAPTDTLPVTGTAALRFASASEPVSTGDYRFARHLGQAAGTFFAQFGTLEDDVADAYNEFAHKTVAGKMGGYSNPAQDDPRAAWPEEDWIVLLELHSGELGKDFWMMWGDMGMGAFYIRRNDLVRRDFSRVVYYWDNH